MKEARLCSAFGEIHVFHRLWFVRVPLYEYRDLRIRHTEGWKSQCLSKQHLVRSLAVAETGIEAQLGYACGASPWILLAGGGDHRLRGSKCISSAIPLSRYVVLSLILYDVHADCSEEGRSGCSSWAFGG